jgi:hypothetical protein
VEAVIHGDGFSSRVLKKERLTARTPEAPGLDQSKIHKISHLAALASWRFSFSFALFGSLQARRSGAPKYEEARPEMPARPLSNRIANAWYAAAEAAGPPVPALAVLCYLLASLSARSMSLRNFG